MFRNIDSKTPVLESLLESVMVFSCEYCNFLRAPIFEEHLRAAASSCAS